MHTKLRAALAAGIVVAFCADAALAQRSSTMEERLFLSSNGQRFGEWPNGHFIGTYKAATPQQCRDICLANKQCRYWYWTVPGRYSRTPETDESCELLAGILKAEPGQGDPGNYAGRVTDRPTTAGGTTPSPAAPPASTPSAAPAAGQAFPLPPVGTELVFRVPAPQDPNIERYATFKFLSHNGQRVRLQRRAWEGPLAYPSSGGADQTVDQIFDEVPSSGGTSSCSVTASDSDLRRIAVGAKLTYTRSCNTIYPNGGRSRSDATITRTVERTEQVTVPAGTFEAVVVRKFTRTAYESFYSSGDPELIETSENEVTRWWVPALGFYVKEQSRNRVVERDFSGDMIERYRRAGETITLPRSTDWSGGPAMVLIQIR